MPADLVIVVPAGVALAALTVAGVYLRGRVQARRESGRRARGESDDNGDELP